MNNPGLRVLFLGTPDFATGILKKLVENKFNIVGVVTNPDKPAGRGQKIQKSSVKLFAEENNLKIFQPQKLKDEKLITELKELKIDIGVVVAFRMLPEILWSLPRLGTINLHASLLPDYRGAAPINWAIINGEKKTGVTTFFLQHEIDTGKIIFREKVDILNDENAGNLHDKLMDLGSKLVVKTLNAIESDNYPQIEQSSLSTEKEKLNIAPKIFKNTCRINWNDEATKIYNLTRGLSPYPTAWTIIKSFDNKLFHLKIYSTSIIPIKKDAIPGTIFSDNKTYLQIKTNDDLISIEEIQLEGKKRLKINEFLRGFESINVYKAE